MLRIWGWVKRVPLVGWLIAVIALLGSACWYLLQQRVTRPRQRRKADEERHKSALVYIKDVSEARKSKDKTLASINREKLLREGEIQERRDAIDTAEREGREALLARLDAAILRRKK